MWDILAEQMRSSADWRRSVAEQHPEDASRNSAAAELLEALADKVERLDNPVLLWQYEAIAQGDSPERLTEVEQDEIRLVGFHSSPATASEFVQGILDGVRA